MPCLPSPFRKTRTWAIAEAGYRRSSRAQRDPVDAPQPRARRAAAGTTIKRKLSGAGAAMPKQRVGLRRELAGAPRTREGFSRKFLLRFICEKHTLSFRYAELDALLAAHGVDPKAAYAAPAGGAAGAGADPYVAVAFPSAACCAEVVSKAILVRDALEVWGEGGDHAACAAAVAAAPAEGTAPFFAADVSWCVHVEGFGYSFSGAEQEAVRGVYRDALPFRGRVRLKGADEQFRILEVYGDVNRGGPRPAPSRCYFGRVVACSKARDLVHACDLKRRIYLGPTALDNELALVMANCARCDVGSLVLDPFAGTGSILVACALFGGFCYGSDIDWKVLRGKGEHENDGATRRRGMRPRKSPSLPVDALRREDGKQKTLFSNFRQYGLAPPEILRLDASRLFDSFRGPALAGTFDCVVSDPPYGIRAGARCSGAARDDVKAVPDHLRAGHVPATRPYPVADVLADLLEIAARCLKVGGRLAYLLPATADFDASNDCPAHPALAFVAACAQPVSAKYARHLVVMAKARPWGAADWTPAARALVKQSVDAPYENLRAKLAEPAKPAEPAAAPPPPAPAPGRCGVM